MPELLHVRLLELRNFKSIAELDLALDKSLTVLTGVNGVGTSSAIQALLAAVTNAWSEKRGGDRYPLFQLAESVRRGGFGNPQITIEVARSGQLPPGAEYSLRNEDLKAHASGGRRMSEYLGNPPIALPLIVYYAQNRTVSFNASHNQHFSFGKNTNRESSLGKTTSSLSEFKAWFIEKEGEEGRKQHRNEKLEHDDGPLKTVRRLLVELADLSAIWSRNRGEGHDREVLVEKEGNEIPFDSLSGGEQALLVLSADLGRRLMIEFPEMPVHQAPGLVCIDKIELHLHPAWQSKILGRLMKMFPACQFVVSTQAPQVLAGVGARHIRLLSEGDNGIRSVSQPIASKGRDSNYILKAVLNTPEQDDSVSELFDTCDRLIDERKLEAAESVLRKLDEAVEGGSARVAIRPSQSESATPSHDMRGQENNAKTKTKRDAPLYGRVPEAIAGRMDVKTKPAKEGERMDDERNAAVTCEEIVHWLASQRDDPDPWHDGYHRTIAVVIATTQEHAREVQRRVWEGLALRWKGERENELCTMWCSPPTNGNRYRFDRAHWSRVLEAAGRTAPAIGAVHAALAHEQWTEPKVIAMVDADHLAEVPQCRWSTDNTGDWIRTLSDRTRVRQVLFGTNIIASAVFSSARSAARSRAFRVELKND